MKNIVALLSLAVLSFSANAETPASVDPPELAVGDSWTYQRVDLHNKDVLDSRIITIKGKTDKDYLTETQNKGGVTQGFMTLNLGDIQFFRGERVDSNYLNFPLTQGKSWKARDFWRNSLGGFGFVDFTYTVVGKEVIAVPAGKFETLKVQGTGWWTNAASQDRVSRQVEATIWYSPDVKGIVRYERKHPLLNWVDNWAYELTAFTLK